MEGSASRLVFCSTLAALVSVISVLCSRILRSLRGWVIMGTPWQFALNKTPPASPNLGFTICHLSLFPLGFADSRVIFILTSRASASLSVGPIERCPGLPGATLGWPTRRLAHLSVPWERDMCSSYRDLSAHSGGVAGLVLTCRSVLKNRDTESDWNISGGGLFLRWPWELVMG